jgi:hypothetical protein
MLDVRDLSNFFILEASSSPLFLPGEQWYLVIGLLAKCVVNSQSMISPLWQACQHTLHSDRECTHYIF